ncbi:MAG: ribulose-phosphate 3-epimerase [Patescibacteria group bacterium]
MQVIPAVNCHLGDTKCVEEKVRAAEKFAGWIHLDVADGKFTLNKTWADPTGWAGFRTKLKLEVHLMVEEPEKYISQWLAAEAKRFVLHVETLTPKTARLILEEAQKHGAEIMLTLNPETSVEVLRPYFKLFGYYQVLSVHPGFAGQKFLPLSLNKLRFLRKELPDVRIQIDGGVNAETGKLSKEAGADILLASSYIFGSKNPKKAYETLKKL